VSYLTIKTNVIEGLDYWTACAERQAELMNYTYGAKVLDVGTGWGACLIAAAKEVGPNGHVIGIDLWKNRIQETLENAKRYNLTNISAEIMDARSITFDENSFDYVVSGFLGFDDIFDFDNHKYRTENSIMKHIYRVLKKDGIAGFSTWLQQGDLDCLRNLIKKYLKDHTNATSLEIANVPVSYSNETSIGFEKLLLDVEFKDIKIMIENFVLRYPTTDVWFETMKNVGWILWKTFKNDKKAILKFKEKILPDYLDKYQEEDGYHFTKKVLFAFGTK
jgi:ubiquinone/menaquinone biosynthesis C-methylase UbiE